MGGNQSTPSDKATESTGKIIEKINNYSGRPGSKNPDDASVYGMNQYLNGTEGNALTAKVGSTGFERHQRFEKIKALASDIGMGDEAKSKLIFDAYNTLNTQAKYLENFGVPKPSREVPTQTPSVVQPERGNTHQHSRELTDSANALASNPHSYSSLSGKTAESLLALDSNALSAVVTADRAFMDKTANHWNLAIGQRHATAQHVNANYDRQLGVRLGLVGQTHATPQMAFENGKDAAINAVNQGLDLYGGHNNSVLKAFGQAALSINLATDPSQTLAGRGANTISEQTMSHNPDGHSQGGPRRY